MIQVSSAKGPRSPPMDVQWDDVKRVFQAALDLPAESRLAWVNRECAGDERLCAAVRSLLAAYHLRPNFLEAPALLLSDKVFDTGTSDTSQSVWVGRQLGS